MKAQVNWHRIRSELQRLADVDKLKAEVHRIGGELRRFDYHAVLSPQAATKVKEIEKRYDALMRRLHVAQRQVDREIERIMKQIKSHRDDAASVFSQQRDKLEKVSTDFRARFKAKRGASSPPNEAGSTKTKRKGPGRPKAAGARTSKAKPRN